MYRPRTAVYRRLSTRLPRRRLTLRGPIKYKRRIAGRGYTNRRLGPRRARPLVAYGRRRLTRRAPVRRRRVRGNGFFGSIRRGFSRGFRGIKNIRRTARNIYRVGDKFAGRASGALGSVAQYDPTGYAGTAKARLDALRVRGRAGGKLLGAGRRRVVRRRPRRLQGRGFRSVVGKAVRGLKRGVSYARRHKAVSRTARALGNEFGSDNLRGLADMADLAGFGRGGRVVRRRRRIAF